MLKKFAAPLFCMVTTGASFAQSVEFRSSDGFISVDGEVVGFNGRMISVDTTVGRVSVPASEVGCYGAACPDILASNDFGLTADDLQGVFTGEEPEVAETPPAAAPVTDNLTVTFANADYGQLFDTLTSAFTVAGDTSIVTDTATPGTVTLRDDAASVTAVLDIDTESSAGDIQIATFAMNEPADLQYPSAPDWAFTAQPSHQLLGVSTFAVITPGNVTVEEISIAELAGIYAGEITNWSELGGNDANILPLQLPVGARARADLIRTVMEPSGKTIASSILTMADEASIVASVNQFPGSISVVGIDNLADNKILAVAGACDVAVAPTPFNIASGDYPLVRPVMATYGSPVKNAIVRDLFDFASGPMVQSLVERDGYANLSAVVQAEANKNTRLNELLQAELTDVERLAAAQMFQDLFPADRLSPTMYGGPTSGPEGAWNRAMFQKLRMLLATDEYSGREVIFVGFAESANGTEAAIDISRQAANVMRATFVDYAAETLLNNGLQVTSLGFGSLAPPTCYKGQVSINAYTRVEVWVR